jgi:hypothetical protein
MTTAAAAGCGHHDGGGSPSPQHTTTTSTDAHRHHARQPPPPPPGSALHHHHRPSWKTSTYARFPGRLFATTTLESERTRSVLRVVVVCHIHIHHLPSKMSVCARFRGCTNLLLRNRAHPSTSFKTSHSGSFSMEVVISTPTSTHLLRK